MKRFLSLILAVTLVASLFTVNVMAASKAHTITLSADKTTELKAGDTVTIEVRMDNTFDIKQCGYILTYDATAFTVDTTKVSRLEKCIDKTWLDGMKDPDGDWSYYLGNPTYNVGIAGEINFQWAGGANGGIGVDDASYIRDNRLIGKFYLQVAENVADGTYTFALTGTTTDGSEEYGADMVCAPITVKVGADDPQPVAPTFGANTAGADNGVAIEGTNDRYDNAYAVDVTVTPNDAEEVGVLFIPEAVATTDTEWTTAAKATFAGLGKGETTVKAAIINIPRALEGIAFKMLAKAYAVLEGVTTYGAVSEKTILFEDSGINN